MIGEKLLELRKKKGLSQEEVAQELNVSRQTISKWETDQSTPDFDKIIPLGERLEEVATMVTEDFRLYYYYSVNAGLDYFHNIILSSKPSY